MAGLVLGEIVVVEDEALIRGSLMRLTEVALQVGLARVSRRTILDRAAELLNRVRLHVREEGEGNG